MKKIIVVLVLLLFALNCYAQVNVALNKPTTQSSNPFGWPPQNAVDGNIATGCHTGNAAEEWWQVDLLGAYCLESIEIVNRAGFLTRLNGAVLKVLDNNGNLIYESDPVANSPVSIVFDNDGAGFEMVGYIRVEQAGQYLTIMELRALAASAVNVSPVDGAVGVLIDKADTSENSPTLKWAAHQAVEAGDITGYYLYFGTDQAAVSAAVKGDATMLGSSYMTTTTYQHATDLDKDATYYWRVDTRLQDDPNTVPGDVWSFKTELTLPQIITQPVGGSKLPGGNFKFTVEAIDPLEGDLNYQWLFDPNLSDEVAAEELTDETDATLTITGITDANAGYYSCKVSNATDPLKNVETNQVALNVGTKVAHWPFDGSVNEVVNNVTCTAQGGLQYTAGKIGDNAIELNGTDAYVSVPVAAIANVPADRFSIVMWFASETDGSAGQNVFGAYDAANKRILSSHFPWGGGTVYFDAGDASGYDRINAAAGSWIGDGEWHQVVFTKDVSAGTMSIYIDGALWLRGTGKGKSLGEVANMVLGANLLESDGSVAHFYNGKMDDVKIYDIALDGYDVAQLYYDVTGGSQCLDKPASDLNDDCLVDLRDFAILAGNWMLCNKVPATACNE